MISERRRAANRANAARSTGPRTAEGKARSSRNATSHGLTAARIALGPAEDEGYRRRLADWEADLRPTDEVERELVARAVFASVVLGRIVAFEAAGGGLDPARARVVRRHEPRWSRALQQALNDLHQRRATPDRTNPTPVAPTPRAETPARRNEATDLPDEATGLRHSKSFLRRSCGVLPGTWTVAAALVLSMLGTPSGTRTGHERTRRGHVRAPQ